MIVIDGTDLVLGRVAAFAAKRALEGETVEVINAESLVISGNKESIFERYRQKRERGNPHHGPFVPRRADLFAKRVIRGMLPHRQPRGMAALRRIKCYKGVPEGLKGKKVTKLEYAHLKNLGTVKYTTVGEISKLLGAK